MTRSQVLQFGLLTGVIASGYGVMFTVLDDFRDEYGIAAHWLGAIVGVGFLSAFVAQVFLAPIADRGHARRMVVTGLLLSVVGLVGLAFGTTLFVLLLGRVVWGIGIGLTNPAVRRIVISGDPDHVGRNLGMLLSADVTGFAAGPALSALLVPSLGLSAPFLAIAALSLVLLPIVFRVDIAEADVGAIPPGRFAFDLLRERTMIAALMMGSAVFLMIGTFDALWAIVLDDLDAGEVVANIGITIFALPLIVLGSTGGRLAQRFGPFRVGPLGLIVGALFMFSYGQLPTGGAMLAFGVVHAISDGLTVASAGVAVGVAAPDHRQAGAQGMLGAVESSTAAVTSALAGVLYSVGGRALAYTVCSVVMIGLAIAAFLLAGPERGRRAPGELDDLLHDPATAVTGHA